MTDSTLSATPRKAAKKKPEKPEKPYPEFPLFAHATRRWAKKIRGQFHYFGPWDDPDAALEKYLDEKDYLHAGKRPPEAPEDTNALTVMDLCNRFLTIKRDLLRTREITERTFRDYYVTCERIMKQFGKSLLVDDLGTSDFQQFRKSLAKNRGPVALGNEIQRVRMVFKYANDEGLIDGPMRYGQGFKRPSSKTIRKARAANGKRMFEADELRLMIDAAGVHVKAMILLGINCGFGQSDISSLPKSAIDLDSGWIEFPRPKTEVERRCPLWPETVAALREAIATRPNAKNDADDGLAFLTKYGNRWVRTSKCDDDDDKKRGMSIDSTAQEIRKLLTTLGLKRGRLNFYALRHTFETIGGESRDQVAVDAIMGHIRDDMASLYRERISDERLTAVTDTIHVWLFPAEGGNDD